MKPTITGLFITMLALVFYPGSPAAFPTLKVVTEEFPPYSYTVDGKIRGIATKVVAETLKKAGLKYDLKVYPWRRAYKAIALIEKNVLIYSIYRSPDRERLFAAWIGPILPPAAVYFYKLKARSDIRMTSIDDARRYTIGVVRDDYNHELLKLQKYPHIELANNEIANLLKFLSGRIDLLPSYELTLAARLRQLDTPFQLAEKTFTLIPAEKSNTFMAISRGTAPEIIHRIETAFEQVRAGGTIEKALDDYIQSRE